jgi:hypothetical protein
MSKTERGILGGPGPYFCLYSPECVEEEFSEVYKPRIPPPQRPKAPFELCPGPTASRRPAWRG